MRIRAKRAGVGSARYSEWEHEKELIPLVEYCMQIARFSDEIRKHKCNNCFYYNGEPGDGEQFCDSKEIYVPENNYCTGWMRKSYE